ncbi:MAG TPA: DNRLRE domain-containing protein [Tepidisphaeraceae bacterium]|nr:DNRLRE domain-containing protein [Tepidisphaeraceae bacterium]
MRDRKRTKIAGAAVVLAGISVAAPAAPAAPLVAFKDTFVRGGTSATNTSGGSANQLAIKADTGDANLDSARKTLLGFNLSAVPVGQVVDQAALTFNLTGSLGGTLGTPSKVWEFSVFGLTDQSLDGWTEAATNWNNAPGNDTTSQINVLPAKTTLVGTFSLTGEGTGAVTITGAALDTFLRDDTNGTATFILVRNTRADMSNTIIHGITAREGAAGATLEVPEPGSAALLVVGGGILARRRRR